MCKVNEIIITSSSTSLTVGEYITLTAEVLPTNATNKNIRWESDDDTIASVNNKGRVEAHTVGITKIRAVALDGSGVSGYIVMQVNPIPIIKVTSVTLNKNSISLEENEALYLSAIVCPASAADRSLTWTSNNNDVARVNTSGKVCGISEGTAIITAKNNASGCKDTCTVTVTPKKLVNSVSVTPSYLELKVGQSAALNAVVCPSDAEYKAVAWQTSNSGVASVNNVSGIVKANNIGTAQICARALDGSNKYGVATVKVTPIYTETLKVLVSMVTIYKGHYAYHPEIQRTPAVPTDPTLYWTSEDSDKVVVDSKTGCLYAKNCTETNKPVKVTVTAKDGSNVETQFFVEVKPIPVESIKVTPSAKLLSPGDTFTVYASIEPTNATNISVTWSSSNNRVATVNASSGQVKAISNGTAIITASAEDGRKIAKSTIIVDSRERVIVEKDGDLYSKITFENGKTWNCLNRDAINEHILDVNEPFTQRFYDNVYESKMVDNATGLLYYSEPFKEYSDEELKLIYTIDPHGLCAYVQIYANALFMSGSDTQNSLAKTIKYKDNIFKLLFKRNPKYYRRDLNNIWYETSNISNLSEVLSESEFLFGRHPVYDIVTLRQFITVVLDIFSMIIGCTALKGTKIEKVLNFYSLGRAVVYSILTQDFNEFITAIVEYNIDEDDLYEDDLYEDFITPSDYKSKNYTLGWAFELLSLGSDLGALADTFSNGPHFYKDVFNQCESDLSYNILIKTSDNKFISISEINSVI